MDCACPSPACAPVIECTVLFCFSFCLALGRVFEPASNFLKTRPRRGRDICLPALKDGSTLKSSKAAVAVRVTLTMPLSTAAFAGESAEHD